MSVMVIRPERGCDDIHALIDHVLSDGAGCTEADFPDSCRGRFVILTPASLRAYVEKQVLQSMVRPEFRERLEPGMNVGGPFSGKHDELDYRQPGLWKVHSPINQHDVAEKLRSEVSE